MRVETATLASIAAAENNNTEKEITAEESTNAKIACTENAKIMQKLKEALNIDSSDAEMFDDSTDADWSDADEASEESDTIKNKIFHVC